MPASLGYCDLSSLQNERALADEHLVFIWQSKQKKKKIIKKREKPLDSDVKTQQQQKKTKKNNTKNQLSKHN